MHEYLPRQTITIILGFILICSSSVVWSARDYNIELIIFRYAGTEQYNAEHWPDSWQIPDTQESLSLDKIPWKQREQFKKLGSGERTLNAVAESLNKSERYQVLKHLAWRQPGLNKNDAINVKIQAGQVYRQITAQAVSEFTDEQQKSPAMGSLFITQENQQDTAGLPIEQNKAITIEYEAIDATSANDNDKLVYELSGNFKVVISRFVHVYADFLLMQPVTLRLEQAAATSDAYTNTSSETLITRPKYRLTFSKPDLSFTTLHGFYIDEHRRMRSDELNFIDHPLLGIIVKAWAAPEK
ncbi:MAG: hypothetical protein JXA04_02045 [Gammaproteobacteria bacterium]|nr:hypothetical protein [Gammaproteobacteria bacterium]